MPKLKIKRPKVGDEIEVYFPRFRVRKKWYLMKVTELLDTGGKGKTGLLCMGPEGGHGFVWLCDVEDHGYRWRWPLHEDYLG